MLRAIVKFFNSQLYAMSLYSRQIAGTAVLLLVVRFLSVYDYGLFASYNQIAAFCLLIANVGYAEYILVSSQKNVREVQLKIGMFLIFAILLTISVLFVSKFIPLESWLIFALVLVRTFFDSIFFGLMLPYYQASEKFNLISYINIFYSAMTILLALICYLFKLNLVIFLLMGIGLGVFNFIQCTYYAKINYILVIKHFKDLIKKIDKSILMYAGSTLSFWICGKIPSLYVATFIHKEKAALFFAALAISNIITILMSAQYQKMIPDMIKVSTKRIKEVIKNNLLFMMGVNFLLLLVFVFMGKFILVLLYSKEYYANALPYLILLTIGNSMLSFASIYGAYLTASGHQNIKLKTMVTAGIITTISILCTYKLDLYSAVISYIVSMLFIGCVYYIKGTQILKAQKIEENNN